jgi:hypothetical protein
MNWNAVVARVMPSIVKIETPSGHGTGFLCFYNEDRSFCGIATACHVIAHAEKWQEPIRITNFDGSLNTLLKEPDRVIWSDAEKDSAVILFSVRELQLPQEPIPLFPTDSRLPIGVEVGWLGYPAIAEYTLCFFSGNVSAVWNFRNAYLIDGVAINGVSGGPVIYSPDATGDNVQIVGAIAAYRANRATGEALPGLSIAQDVAHFQAMLSHVRTLEEAERQRTAPQVMTDPEMATVPTAEEPPAGGAPDVQQI